MSNIEKKFESKNDGETPVRRQTKQDVDSFISGLRKRLEGLVYISETDARIEPVLFKFPGNISIETFVKSKFSDDNVEVRNADVFFSRLTTPQDWFREEELNRAKRYQMLQQYLESNLNDLKVYRVGKIRIDIYILGNLDEGNLCGVKTFAVET